MIRFEHYLLKEKKYSPHTVKAYKKDVLQFVDFFCSTLDNFNAQDVLPQDVRGWVVALMKGGLSSRSVNRKVSSLSAYFIFLKIKGDVSKNPVEKTIRPKSKKRLPQAISPDVMLSVPPPSNCTFPEIRNLLIFELLYTCGIRCSELIGIKVGDVDVQKEMLKVLGKGQKERLIPLMPCTISLINCYIGLRESFLDGCKSDSLFLTSKRKPIYPKFVDRVVMNKLEAVGYTGARSPHILRHTLATQVLNNGGDILSIKELLGHSSIASTEIYTHCSFNGLKMSYKKSHPRSNTKE